MMSDSNQDRPQLEQFCRALAAHAALVSHPHFMQGGFESDTKLRESMDKASSMILSYASESKQEMEKSATEQEVDATPKPRSRFADKDESKK